MDRIALAKRLEGLSKVFVANSPYHRDLRAMAHVLSEIDDEKFRKVLSADFTPDKEAAIPPVPVLPQSGPAETVGRHRAMGGLTPEQKIQTAIEEFGVSREDAVKVLNELRRKKTQVAPERVPTRVPVGVPEGMAMDASETNAEIGKYWNREASEAIRNNLLRDVLGVDKTTCCDTHRHLDKDQIPQGKHAGLPDRGATLKPEQTPDIVPVLDSHIVEKSHGAVRKEAGAEAIHEEKAEEHAEKAEEMKGEAKEHAEKAKETMEEAEKAEDKAEKHEEKAEKVEEKKEAPAEEETPEDKKKEKKEEKKEDKKESKKEAAEPMVVEGIELTASMEDVELSAEESEKLNKLFV